MVNERKTNAIIDYKKNSPLLRVHTPIDYSHFLREIDKSRFRDVVGYLLNRGLEVYLGGSVVEKNIFSGRQDYSDIDLLGILPGNDDGNIDIAQKVPLALARASHSNGIIIGNSGFLVSDRNGTMNKRMYMNLENINERFALYPLPTIVELESLKSRAASLDLTLKNGSI